MDARDKAKVLVEVIGKLSLAQLRFLKDEILYSELMDEEAKAEEAFVEVFK